MKTFSCREKGEVLVKSFLKIKTHYIRVENKMDLMHSTLE